MDKQTVEGVADRDTARLGIVDDGLAHLQVSIFVEVGVHDTSASLYDRYACVVPDKLYKPLSAARNAEVYIPYSVQHLMSGLVSGRHQVYDIG